MLTHQHLTKNSRNSRITARKSARSFGRAHETLRSADVVLCLKFGTTLSNNGLIPRSEMEIIEVGMTPIYYQKAIAPSKQFLVKPELHPELTSLCKNMTGISQEAVDHAPTFAELLSSASFRSEIMALPESTVLAAWGVFDYYLLNNTCKRYGLQNPFEHLPFVDVKELDQKTNNLAERRGLFTAVKTNGLTWEGKRHSGKDDSRNLARLVNTVYLK